MKRSLILPLLLIATPLQAQTGPSLQQRIAAVLAEAGPGTRWGMVIADSEGREVVAIDPEGRYVPASNTKMFTTAAAFWKLPELDQPDQAARTSAYLVAGKGKVSDVVLLGRGDARLSSAADCKVDCLVTIADAIAAKTRTVGNVIGDDSLFPDERWSPGMSWNNIPTRSGTATSALTLDDNEEVITVTAGPDGKANFASSGYFTLQNEVEVLPQITAMAEVSASSPPKPAPQVINRTNLDVARLPGSKVLRITGTLVTGSKPQTVRAGVDDPAERAAWTLAQMLRARGVKVVGRISARHALPSAGEAKAAVTAAVEAVGLAVSEPVAETMPAPHAEDLRIINKDSQNLHAEILLRRVGLLQGNGSIADGQKVVTAMLTEAGLKPNQFYFADGSGMSTYNRVAPRGVVTFLRWTARQPWGESFRGTLPVGGVDGTLANRFKGTSLEGQVFAKTGTLNATNSLAGYFTAKSGRTFTFALYANDVPEGVRATALAERALVIAAEAN
jgi:D-alanyl-D-alanine carboxypeptidase/D-alanyl-D-alanine-endopeptidase (penicillin-binding protein 4)